MKTKRLHLPDSELDLAFHPLTIGELEILENEYPPDAPQVSKGAAMIYLASGGAWEDQDAFAAFKAKVCSSDLEFIMGELGDFFGLSGGEEESASSSGSSSGEPAS